MTWNLYLPTCNPEQKARAQAEVDAVLGGEQQVTLEQYQKLEYVARCVCKSMRLYPHPPVLLRRALGDNGLPGG